MNEDFINKLVGDFLKSEGKSSYVPAFENITKILPELNREIRETLDENITAIAMTYSPKDLKNEVDAAVAFTVINIIMRIAEHHISEMKSIVKKRFE